ncbi:putative cation-transporting ATPase G [Nocardiopsis terrae]|uniref:Cation-transporting ATPase G n=1 Tax=Nocardiopsis terrae TaxID=372655 RepID=A0ABR9HIH3_9ACTN|nr:cation-translocating P-type ATPase [Nocardiopsis terrae]MBE1458788.1 cation-transporting ATPase G [Nocardiopsis terrae]GHC86318.1 putative cation-transporting ATPase G [Nocardiopsis terrae]
MSDACCGDDPTPANTPTSPGSGTTETAEPTRLWQVGEIRYAAVAAPLLLAGYAAGWLGAPEAVVLLLKAAALVVAARTFVPATLRRLFRKGAGRNRIGVGTLMTVAAAGAVALGEVGEAAMLAVLFTIAEGLEEYAVARTRRGLRALLDLVPARATVLRDGVEQTVAPEELRLGQTLVLRPGERLATDGTVASGHTWLDTSAVTGESVPTEVGPGDGVYAGSVNGTGPLEVTVTAGAEDNSLARVVRIVEAEQARKGRGQRLADRVARPLVPGVMVAAVLVAVLGSLFGDPLTWLERALVVLVAASPCALAISVPVTVVAAIGSASRQGALVKGGAALEAMGRVGVVALDKTGTLTRNDPAVVEVVPAPGRTREQVLELAAALEARSEHPLARAVLAAHPSPGPAEDVRAVPGSGLTGRVDGAPVRLGRPGWVDPGPLGAQVERLLGAGATVVLVEEGGSVAGALAVRDELRPEAAGVVAELRRSGYRVAMLTGDHRATADALAAEAGIDPGQVHAGLLPEDKARVIGELRADGPVVMVGDGVNDAPALAGADLGVAMGAMGTDVAVETADVALMGEDLRNLPRVLAHARRTRVIMWQSLGLSLAIIGVLMPLALFGVLGLAAVVLVHEVAEVVVIANGMRAGRARPERTRAVGDGPEGAVGGPAPAQSGLRAHR